MARRSASGRTGSTRRTRELLTLLSSLSEPGDALSVDAVSEQLGVSAEHAEKLIGLVLSTGAEDGVGLPLTYDEAAREVTLVGPGILPNRQLRLTRRETLAIQAALDLVGLSDDDPIRAQIAPVLAADPPTTDHEGANEAERLAIDAAARSQLRHQELVFSYTKPGSDRVEERHVVVRGARMEDGVWYLDAWDEDRGEERVFRMDRMSGATTGRAATAPAPAPKASARQVSLRFHDAHYLELLDWHGFVPTQRDADGTVCGTIPDFDGDWLPRMICACGGTVTTDDEGLRERVRAYATSQLEGLAQETQEPQPEP